MRSWKANDEAHNSCLSTLIDIEGYAVPFGEHERMMDLPVATAIASVADRRWLQ